MEPTKLIQIGEAGHITSASKNGPRYDSSLTFIERTGLENGIWLCRNCHAKVDSDTSNYSVSTLQLFKKNAESEAKKNIGGRHIIEESALARFLNSESCLGICIEANYTQSYNGFKKTIGPAETSRKLIFIGNEIITTTTTNHIDSIFYFAHSLVSGTSHDFNKTSYCETESKFKLLYNKVKNHDSVGNYFQSFLSLKSLLESKSSQGKIFNGIRGKVINAEEVVQISTSAESIVKSVADDFDNKLLVDALVIMDLRLEMPAELISFIEQLLNYTKRHVKVILCLPISETHLLPFSSTPYLLRLPIVTDYRDAQKDIERLTDPIFDQYSWFFEERSDFYKALKTNIVGLDNQRKLLYIFSVGLHISENSLKDFNLTSQEIDIINYLDVNEFGHRGLPMDFLACAQFGNIITLYDLTETSSYFRSVTEIETIYYGLLIEKKLLSLDIYIVKNSRNAAELKLALAVIQKVRALWISNGQYRREIEERILVTSQLIGGLYVSVFSRDFFTRILDNKLISSKIASISCYILGFMMYYIGEIEEAIDYLYKSIDKNPNNVNAICLLAMLIWEKDIESHFALELLDEASKIEKKYEFSYYYKAIILESENNYSNAIMSYTKALSINPGFYECLFNIMNCFLKENCSELAMKCADICYSIKPDNYSPWYNCASELADQGKFGLAYDILAELKERHNDDIINFNMALIALKKRDKKLGKSLLSQAIRSNIGESIKDTAREIYKDLTQLEWTKFSVKYNLNDYGPKVPDRSWTDKYKNIFVTFKWLESQNSKNSTSLLAEIASRRKLLSTYLTSNNSTQLAFDHGRNYSESNMVPEAQPTIQESKLKSKTFVYHKMPSYGGG